MSPTRVILCRVSNSFLPVSCTLSAVDSGALLAARCAALSRCTRCSSVSPTGAPFPGAEVLDLGCGVVDVKRVASVALRGVVREDILRTAPRAGDERSRNAGMWDGVWAFWVGMVASYSGGRGGLRYRLLSGGLMSAAATGVMRF